VPAVVAHDPESVKRLSERACVFVSTRTATRFATPGDNALHEDGAPKNAGRRPIEKARGRFPGAGSNIFAMLNLCR
jgi:hypothetical protein